MALPINILHIGYPKTGTTWLQKRIFPKLHLNYVGRQYRDNLGKSSYIFGNDTKLDNKNKDFYRISQKCTGPLNLCSDELILFQKDIIKAFGSNLRILMTIRNQTDLFRSTYSHFKKRPGVPVIKDLEDFFKRDVISDALFNFFDFYQKFCYLKDITPHVQVVPMELIWTANWITIKRLARFLDQPPNYLRGLIQKEIATKINHTVAPHPKKSVNNHFVFSNAQLPCELPRLYYK